MYIVCEFWSISDWCGKLRWRWSRRHESSLLRQGWQSWFEACSQNEFLPESVSWQTHRHCWGGTAGLRWGHRLGCRRQRAVILSSDYKYVLVSRDYFSDERWRNLRNPCCQCTGRCGEHTIHWQRSSGASDTADLASDLEIASSDEEVAPAAGAHQRLDCSHSTNIIELLVYLLRLVRRRELGLQALQVLRRRPRQAQRSLQMCAIHCCLDSRVSLCYLYLQPSWAQLMNPNLMGRLFPVCSLIPIASPYLKNE